MPRVNHVELTADDIGRAAAFSRAVFGWELSSWGGDPLQVNDSLLAIGSR